MADKRLKEVFLSNFIVRKVAVLGAGVMGTQIAAHLANAEIPVVLFDLPAKEGDPNGLVKAALATIRSQLIAISMPPASA